MHVLFIPQNLPANFSTHGFGQTLNELNFPEIKITLFKGLFPYLNDVKKMSESMYSLGVRPTPPPLLRKGFRVKV